MGWYDANDTMLRRSNQLVLVAENDHFEGSTHLKAKEGTNTRLGERREGSFLEQKYLT